MSFPVESYLRNETVPGVAVAVAVVAAAAVCSSASFSGVYLFVFTFASPLPSPNLLVRLTSPTLAHSPSGAVELERLFWAVSTPGNPEYLQHRSISQLKAIIGASEDTLSKAKAFLRAAGASNIIVSPLADHVVGKFSIAEAATLGASRCSARKRLTVRCSCRYCRGALQRA